MRYAGWFAVGLGMGLVFGGGEFAARGSTELSQGWAFVSANQVTDAGTTISQPGYNVSSWYPVTLPSTIMAGLLANGVYTNVFFGTNFQSLPDLTLQKWWYRGAFAAPAAVPGGQYWLRFKGVAYRAQIWLNGVALDTNAVGTMVLHEYNVTSLIQPGATNTLALLITPPSSAATNLSYYYVDWNPAPPDMNGGICGKVLLDATGPVVLRDPYVKTVLPLPATNSASLTVYVDAANGSSNSVTGTLSGTIAKTGYPTINFSQNVTLNAGVRQEITFDPATFTQLNVTNPALWWPINMGRPDLYNLQLTFSVNGQTSDTESVNFGIRQFSDYITPTIYGNTYRGYKVNGQNVLLRGADYVWDLFMRWNTKTNQTHMNYIADMGLNTIRFEGILGNEEFYDMADQSGVMLLPGFVCCTYWVSWSSWKAEDTLVASNSLNSQMRLMRAHPCALVWAYGSDELPTNSVLTMYRNISTNLHWQNPTLDNVASYNNTGGSVPKMNGPYVWEPPVYWYYDTNTGGAFGICAEEGGEAVPPLESLQKFLAVSNLWPISSAYGYHAGEPPTFNNLNFYSPGVTNRYGAATNMIQYTDRAELLNYESERAQFEAFGANAYTLAQGTIYWMLNNAWPSVHWSLYDYYFKQGGGYFGTKKALEPVHILYDYNAKKIKVFNSTLTNGNNLTASAAVYNIPNLALAYSNSATTNFPANSATTAFALPAISGLSNTYFMRLQLKGATGALVSDNLYWYSTTPDALGSSSTWYNTTVKTYANLTGLNSLVTNTNVTASASRAITNGQETLRLMLTNTSATNIAFFLRAEVTAGLGGLEVLPILYTGNYVTLWPGETTAITASYASADLGGQTAFLRLRGYNVPELDTTVATPLTASINLSGASNISICWSSASNATYQVQYSSNLAANSWTALGSPTNGNGSLECASDVLQPTSPRYYRVCQLP